MKRIYVLGAIVGLGALYLASHGKAVCKRNALGLAVGGGTFGLDTTGGAVILAECDNNLATIDAMRMGLYDLIGYAPKYSSGLS